MYKSTWTGKKKCDSIKWKYATK